MKLVPDLTSCPLEFYAFLKNKNISIDLVKVMQRCSFCTMLFSRNDLFYLNGSVGNVHSSWCIPPSLSKYVYNNYWNKYAATKSLLQNKVLFAPTLNTYSKFFFFCNYISFTSFDWDSRLIYMTSSLPFPWLNAETMTFVKFLVSSLMFWQIH